MPDGPVWQYDLDDARLRAWLASLLPHSLTVVRLCQFLEARAASAAGEAPISWPTTPLLVGSFAPEDLPGDEPFAVWLFAPTEPRAIDACVFTSLDVEGVGSGTAGHKTEHTSAVVAHTLAIARYIAKHWTPLTETHGPHGLFAGQSSRIILLGAINSALVSAILDLNNGQPESTWFLRADVTGKFTPYAKYAWRTSSSAAFLHLPDTLAFDAVEPRDHDRILATNSLVRSRAFLSSLPSAGVRDSQTGRLVAWAYHGVDGSTRTVFCEPEWRGQGLARAAVAKLCLDSLAQRQTLDLEPSDDADPWQHSDVAADNIASVKLFERFGAEIIGHRAWIFVDLRRVPP